MHRVRRNPGFFGSILLGGLLLGPTPGHSQLGEGISVQVNPSTVRLGQLFHLEIRVRSPEGRILEVPDSIEGLRGFHPAGPARVTRTNVGQEGVDWNIAYPLIPLRTGYRPLPSLNLRMGDPEDAGGQENTRRVQVPLGGVPVESVLPPPGQTIAPAPPLLPLRSGSGSFPPTFLTLTGVLLSGLGWLVTRKRRGVDREGQTPVSIPGNPKEQRSLVAQLQKILRRVPSSALDAIRVFDETVPLLRRILEDQVNTSLAGCTTPELMRVLSGGRPRQELRDLESALQKGDNARFRKTPPTLEDLRIFQEGLITWLEGAVENGLRTRAGGSNV